MIVKPLLPAALSPGESVLPYSYIYLPTELSVRTSAAKRVARPHNMHRVSDALHTIHFLLRTTPQGRRVMDQYHARVDQLISAAEEDLHSALEDLRSMRGLSADPGEWISQLTDETTATYKVSTQGMDRYLRVIRMLDLVCAGLAAAASSRSIAPNRAKNAAIAWRTRVFELANSLQELEAQARRDAGLPKGRPTA